MMGSAIALNILPARYEAWLLALRHIIEFCKRNKIDRDPEIRRLVDEVAKHEEWIDFETPEQIKESLIRFVNKYEEAGINLKEFDFPLVDEVSILGRKRGNARDAHLMMKRQYRYLSYYRQSCL